MYLPGTPGDRVADLRLSRGWNQKELAQKIGLSASQVSRIESGKTKSVSSDILIKLAGGIPGVYGLHTGVDCHQRTEEL